MGGSFFVAPALLVLGHSAPTAVGTGLTFVFWTSLTATVIHRDLDHIDYRIGLLLIAGMTTGIEIGRRVLLVLVDIGLADIVVSVLYIVFLATVGVFIIQDGRHPAIENENTVVNQSTVTSYLEQVSIPPMLEFTNLLVLVLREDFGEHCIDSELVSNRVSDVRRVITPVGFVMVGHRVVFLVTGVIVSSVVGCVAVVHSL